MQQTVAACTISGAMATRSETRNSLSHIVLGASPQTGMIRARDKKLPLADQPKIIMKPIQRTLLLSLIPFTTAIAAAADKVAETTTPVNTSAASEAKPSNSWRASSLIGTNIKNADGDTVGEIKDLYVDLKTQEVVSVIVSTGGFLGIADTLSSLPLSSLKYDSQAKVFKISMSKSQLEKQPQFKSGAWPDSSDEAMSTKLRGIRDAVGGDVSAPDNTANNEQEVKKNLPSTMDQGNSEGDLNLTKDIRSAVVGADLSFNAKNIKIISNNSHVTLRGVVESEDEHQAILKLARAHADPAKITDDVKVKTK